jgi:tRNA (adenine22-N1)-methyltransferase
MNPSPRIGPRLNTIFELVKKLQQKQPYPLIWDCCCDHGYLGIKILREQLCEKLIFVDQLPHIIQQLTKRLEPYSTGKHELIVADAGDLKFNSNMRHLVILAGVGGETSVEIIRKIEAHHPDAEIDYVFCPSASHNELREYLVAEDYGLVFEDLVYEKKRYYEILFVQKNTRSAQLPRLTLSCELWDDNNADHQRYLKKINSPRASKKPKRKRIKQ